MNAFEELLSLSVEEKKTRGLEFTPTEIAQQPSVWRKTVALLIEQREALLEFMRRTGMTGKREAVIVLSGAGSSEFIGNAVANALRVGLRREVLAVPTTHMVTHGQDVFVPGHRYVLVSFARSGNSPESLAAWRVARKTVPDIPQMVITCNSEGALAREAGDDGNAICFVLPEETNDRGLAMTSSFSSMALTALALPLLKAPQKLKALVESLSRGAERVISKGAETLSDFAEKPFTRACFLGSNTLYGTMQECHLKMQEMTEGRVACCFESFLGLRHGPQVFVNNECVVVAALSTDPFVRLYEVDMLRELKRKQQSCGVLAICDRETTEISDTCTHVVELYPNGKPVADTYRVVTDVAVGQMLALFKSLKMGLKPDNPSESGTINRVVQGVTIYER